MILSTALLTGAGCTLKVGPSSASVLASTDAGLTWKSHATLVTGKNRSVEIANADVTRIVFDTTNPDTMFFGTKEGLYGSNTAGATWTSILPGQYISDIALHPTDHCMLYALTPIRALKTTNCGTTWGVLLNEARENVGLTVLTIDQSLPTTVYTATSVGDIFKSRDGGQTWTVLTRFSGQNIRRFLIDPHDSSVLYVATAEGGIFRSRNQGVTWTDISQSLRAVYAKQNISLAYRGFNLFAGSGRLFYASNDGLFRSLNGGTSWEKIPVLTPSGSAKIFAARVDPSNTSVIYYATQTTFYRTNDSGSHWVARPIVSTGDPYVIAPHPIRSGIVFLGMRVRKEQDAYWYRGSPDY
ncbi:MAG: hypothetical protein Q7S47_00715 [bacterium]|nr:hypothetical protein [bacterium]